MEYIPGDFILIDKHNTIQGVSGNTDFWDQEESMPAVNPNRTYLIAKVMVVQEFSKEEGSVTRQELYEGSDLEEYVLTIS
jgi:hypothetical protein